MQWPSAPFVHCLPGESSFLSAVNPSTTSGVTCVYEPQHPNANGMACVYEPQHPNANGVACAFCCYKLLVLLIQVCSFIPGELHSEISNGFLEQ